MLEQKREAAEHRFDRLGPPLDKAHLPFDFDDFVFFFAITYSSGLHARKIITHYK
jgi:hypothetical protein